MTTPTSSCSNDKPQHHPGDDHSAASTNQDLLGSDDVDNAVEESRSESTDHNEKEDANVLDQMKQEDTDREASPTADLALREQSAKEEIAAEASSLTAVTHTFNADLADDEASLASTRVTLKEVKPDIETPNGNDPESIFSAVVAHLTESTDEISALPKKVMRLEEEKERRETELFRMQENNKFLSSEVRRLLRCLKEVNSGVATPNGDDPAVVFSTARAYLTESKNNQSTLSEKLTLLEVENNKISEDLGIMKAALEQAKSRASTAEGDLDWCSQDYKKMQEALETTKKSLEQANSEASSAKDTALCQGIVIDEMKNAIMGIKFPREILSRDIVGKIRWLAADHERKCKALDRTKASFGQARKDLHECILEKKKISEDLDVAKSNLEQANCSANSVRDEANKCLLELQDSLENAESSLASYRDKSTQRGKVIDEMKKVMSHIKLPQEVVSMDIAHKVKWLADERMKTREDLGSVKVNLEQANSRADAAEKELKISKWNLDQANSRADAAEKELKISKWNLDQANSRADAAEKELKMSKLNLEQANSRADAAEKELKMSKLNSEQANSKVSGELGVTKLNLEQAKSELEVRCTELNAADIKVRALEEIKHLISFINFPKEIHPMDTLTSVKWLADYYNNFTNSISGSDTEETKRLLISVKANIHQKIVDELFEIVTVLVEEAVEEATRVEDPNPGAPSSAIHTEPTSITGATSNDQDGTHDVGQHSGSGKRTVIEPTDEATMEEDSNREVSSSAIVADPSHIEFALQHSGSGEGTSVGAAGIQDSCQRPTATDTEWYPPITLATTECYPVVPLTTSAQQNVINLQASLGNMDKWQTFDASHLKSPYTSWQHAKNSPYIWWTTGDRQGYDASGLVSSSHILQTNDTEPPHRPQQSATDIGGPSSAISADASHTEPTNITGATSNEQDNTLDVGQHSGSGERTREEGSNCEVSSSAIVADPSLRVLAQRRSGSGEGSSVGFVSIRDILPLQKQPTATIVRTFRRNIAQSNNRWRRRGPTVAPAVSRSKVRPPGQSNDGKPSGKEGGTGKSGDHNA